MDAQNIFQGKRLEVQFIGGIVVCRYRFRVTVNDDRLESKFFQCKCCMYATVVKFDTLTDSVRATAKNHDLLLIRYGRMIRCVVCGIVVSLVLCTTYVYRLPSLADTIGKSCFSDVGFLYFQNLCQIFIRETILLCLTKNIFCWNLTLLLQKCVFFLNQLLHLLNEVVFDLCHIEQFIYGRTFAKCFVHNELTLRGSVIQQ